MATNCAKLPKRITKTPRHARTNLGAFFRQRGEKRWNILEAIQSWLTLKLADPMTKQPKLNRYPLELDEIIELGDFHSITNKRHAEGYSWYLRGAKLGDATCQSIVGEFHRDGDLGKVDRKAAIRWWRLAAAQKDSEAMVSLGYSYFYGEGVGQDMKLAAYWYRKAAKSGSVRAMYNLGLMYFNGDGVRWSTKISFSYMEKAMSRGHRKARNFLKKRRK